MNDLEKLPMPKRVLCIMDISVVGRAGLSAVLPVLAASGVQACALPAALYSTHTGGFGTPARQNEAEFCQNALHHFSEQKIEFDAIYIGYLCTEDQFDMAEQAIISYPNAMHIVDPAMGDDGKSYSGISDALISRMIKLCKMANLITPNFTESALLLGEDPKEHTNGENLAKRRIDLLTNENCSVVITSVPSGKDEYVSMGKQSLQDEVFVQHSSYVPQRYPGTGDLFTAALCGCILQGNTIKEGVEKATMFVQTAAKNTYEAKAEPRHGLWIEPFLSMLTKERQGG